MTINEIEATLHTLEERHPNLTEDTLLTLLKAGGWEEKRIKEALSLFKTMHVLSKGDNVVVVKPIEKEEKNNVSQPTLPSKEETKEGGMVYYDSTGIEEKKTENFIDSGKDIPALKDGKDISYVQPKIVDRSTTPQPEPVLLQSTEPVSLVTPANNQIAADKKIDPPENLPLKPFESSDHVWPLSRYNDVFHGDVPPIVSRTEAKLIEEHKDEHVVEKPKKVVKLKRTGFDGEDEGLIIVTGISLLIVLLLLTYMYSNGRL